MKHSHSFLIYYFKNSEKKPDSVFHIAYGPNSHAFTVCVSLTPVDRKLWSHAFRPISHAQLTIASVIFKNRLNKLNFFSAKRTSSEFFNNARDWLEILWKSLALFWSTASVNFGSHREIFGSCWEIFGNLLWRSLLNQVCMWFNWLSSDIFSLLSKKRSYCYSMYFFFLFICQKPTRWLANNC